MLQINKLKQEIQAIESSIPSDASKEDLYDLLVVAYNKAKDIIELYSNSSPLIEDNSAIELQELKEVYNLATTQRDIYKAEAAESEQLVMLYLNRLLEISALAVK